MCACTGVMVMVGMPEKAVIVCRFVFISMIDIYVDGVPAASRINSQPAPVSTSQEMNGRSVNEIILVIVM